MESTETRAPVLTLAPPAPLEAPTLDATVAADLPAVVADQGSSDRGLGLLVFAINSREFSLIDVPLLQESAVELMDIVLRDLKATRVDTTIFSDALAFRPDLSLLRSPFGLLGGAARGLLTMRPRTRVKSPDATYPSHVRKIKIKQVAPARVSTPKVQRVRQGPVLRVRWGRVLTRGLSLGLLAAILVAMPAEMIANVGNMASELSVVIREKLAAVTTSTPTLQRASFDVPPLSAYGATFEQQAPYPKVQPNATVEWVVALRNTGSAGWYLGIDGAQASLVLPDGTTAGVQTTAYVGPGQVGWFIVHFTAPSEAGTSKIKLLPRIDGRGSLPDLGIYATVTVSPNP